MSQKILIVEDDLVFRNYLYQVLKYDYDVSAVPGPLEALKALKREPYSLMITDLRMPEMDGRTLVEKVRSEIDPHLMVIVITAFEDDWPVDDAMSTSVFRYLRKGSFLPSELKQNVDKALEMQGSIVRLNEYKRRVDISETIYKDVFDNSTDALFVTDTHLRPVALNRRFEELLGYTMEDLRGKTLFDIIAAEDRQAAVDAFNGQIRGEPPGSMEFSFITAARQERPVRVWARLIKDVRSMANAVFCIARDLEHGVRQQSRPEPGSPEGELDVATRDLHSLERNFSRLTESAKDIIFLLDENCCCEFVNSEVERTLGYQARDFIGRKIPFRDIVHPEDYSLVEQWRDLVKRRTPGYEGEIRIYTTRRILLHFACRLSFEYRENGSISGLVMVLEDITQQKIAQQELKNANAKLQEFNDRLANGVNRKIRELRESEERCKHIVEGFSDIIFSLDSQGRILFMNSAGLATLNTTLDEISGRTWKDFIHDDASIRRMQEIMDVIDNHLVHEPFEMSIETPGGTRFYKANLIRIRDDSRYEIVCVAREISDEVVRNKRLKLLSAIEDVGADAIVCLDPGGTITSWNQGACRIFGWSEEEVLGLSADIMVPEEYLPQARQMLEEMKTSGVVRDRETRRKTRSDQELDVSLSMSVLSEAPGRNFGYALIIRDVSEKKRMEAALIQSERLAATGKLSASIAHEINNPLYGIRSCLNHVLNAQQQGIDHQFVRLAIKETDRIADLIRNMKNFYQPSEGKVETIDIHEALRDVFILNRKYLEENLVKLMFNPEGTRYIECVPEQIKQVFINLIDNAVQAMPDGGELHVVTESSRENNAIEIVFTDTGVGIPPEDLPHIFDMFYTKKTSARGVGLGLSVSYGIIKRHGGTIEVRSTHRAGTTFTITLPVKSPWARQMHLELT